METARVYVSEIDGYISVMDMHYLIAGRGKGVKYYVDRHKLGLFEIDKTLEVTRKVGFDAGYLHGGLMESRGHYTGIRE